MPVSLVPLVEEEVVTPVPVGPTPSVLFPLMPNEDELLVKDVEVLVDEERLSPVPVGPTTFVLFFPMENEDELLLEDIDELDVLDREVDVCDVDDFLDEWLLDTPVPPVHKDPVPVGPHELVPLPLRVTACTVSEKSMKRNRNATMAWPVG